MDTGREYHYKFSGGDSSAMEKGVSHKLEKITYLAPDAPVPPDPDSDQPINHYQLVFFGGDTGVKINIESKISDVFTECAYEVGESWLRNIATPNQPTESSALMHVASCFACHGGDINIQDILEGNAGTQSITLSPSIDMATNAPVCDLMCSAQHPNCATEGCWKSAWFDELRPEVTGTRTPTFQGTIGTDPSLDSSLISSSDKAKVAFDVNFEFIGSEGSYQAMPFANGVKNGELSLANDFKAPDLGRITQVIVELLCSNNGDGNCGETMDLEALLNFKTVAKWALDNVAGDMDPLQCVWEISPHASGDGAASSTTYKLNLCSFREEESSSKLGIIGINALSAAFLGVYETTFSPGGLDNDAVKAFENLPNVKQCMRRKLASDVDTSTSLNVEGIKIYDTRRNEVFFSMRSVTLERTDKETMFDESYENTGISKLISSTPMSILGFENFEDDVGTWREAMPVQRINTDTDFDLTLALIA